MDPTTASSSSTTPPSVEEPAPLRSARFAFVRDDIAYMLPMAIFLAFTQIGVTWPNTYPIGYALKTFIVALVLVCLWPRFTRIKWDYAWLGVIGGIVGIVQWIGMEKLLLHYFPNYPHMHGAAFIPPEQIHSLGWRIAFIAVRWGGATLVVPVMEELFWRDFAWRTVLAPNDFKLASVGEFDWSAWLIVSALFCAVHPQWMTAIVWGLMIGGLLIYTRSLGACIIMHAVTNFLLGAYVLYTGDWMFW